MSTPRSALDHLKVAVDRTEPPFARWDDLLNSAHEIASSVDDIHLSCIEELSASLFRDPNDVSLYSQLLGSCDGPLFTEALTAFIKALDDAVKPVREWIGQQVAGNESGDIHYAIQDLLEQVGQSFIGSAELITGCIDPASLSSWLSAASVSPLITGTRRNIIFARFRNTVGSLDVPHGWLQVSPTDYVIYQYAARDRAESIEWAVADIRIVLKWIARAVWVGSNYIDRVKGRQPLDMSSHVAHLRRCKSVSDVLDHLFELLRSYGFYNLRFYLYDRAVQRLRSVDAVGHKPSIQAAFQSGDVSMCRPCSDDVGQSDSFQCLVWGKPVLVIVDDTVAAPFKQENYSGDIPLVRAPEHCTLLRGDKGPARIDWPLTASGYWIGKLSTDLTGGIVKSDLGENVETLSDYIAAAGVYLEVLASRQDECLDGNGSGIECTAEAWEAMNRYRASVTRMESPERLVDLLSNALARHFHREIGTKLFALVVNEAGNTVACPLGGGLRIVGRYDTVAAVSTRFERPDRSGTEVEFVDYRDPMWTSMAVQSWCPRAVCVVYAPLRWSASGYGALIVLSSTNGINSPSNRAFVDSLARVTGRALMKCLLVEDIYRSAHYYRMQLRANKRPLDDGATSSTSYAQ